MADARLGAQSDEALTDGSPSRRLAAVSAEALTTQAATPSRQLGAVSSEALTVAETIPRRQLAGVSVEVLIPARLTFVGWGTPISPPIWS